MKEIEHVHSLWSTTVPFYFFLREKQKKTGEIELKLKVGSKEEKKRDNIEGENKERL